MLVIVGITIAVCLLVGLFCLIGAVAESERELFFFSLGFLGFAAILGLWINSSYENTRYKVVESKEYTVHPVEATAVIAVGEKVRQLGPPYCGWETVRINKYEDKTNDWFDFDGYEEMVNPAEDEE